MSGYKPEYLDREKSEKLDKQGVIDRINSEEIVEALVISCDDDLTLRIEIGEGIYGFLPFSEIEFRIDDKPSKEVAALSKVGRHVKFIMTDIKETENGTYRVCCSRRKAQEKCYKNYITTLKVGDIIDARVVRAETYGVFCDIGCGIVALMPTNRISITHIEDPRGLFENVTAVKAVVDQINNGRIQLSHKELLGTWEQEVSRFHKGDVVYGTVLTIENYGVFVRLSQNLSGLAEVPYGISLKQDDLVKVRINNINPSNKKIKLTVLDKAEGCTEEIQFRYYKTEGRVENWNYYEKPKK